MAKHKFDFDLIVIGSGAAGYAAATLASSAKLKTAIVEASTWGGSGLNGREVRALSAQKFAHLYAEATSGARFGLSSGNLRYNFPTSRNWCSFAEKRSGVDDKKTLEKAGITCFDGFANFLSPYEISVSSKRITSSHFLIATGSSLFNGHVAGAEQVSCITPQTVYNLTRLPKSVFIVGAGATGCEIAQYLSELGVDVIMADLASRILPREDSESSKIIHLYLEERLKVKILTQSRVLSVESNGTKKKIKILRGGTEKTVSADEIILATGSSPVVDLGLENTGVEFSKNGITTNRYMQTSAKHIYAAGDVLGNTYSSSERAAYEGTLAATNIISRTKNLANYSGFVRLVNTYPMVASVGLTEEECLSRHIKINKSLVALSSSARSNISDFRAGFVKIIAEKKSEKILGATVVCPNADLVVQELAFAIRHGLTVRQLASTPHVASSWSEVVRIAARKLVK